jgi:cellulose synthase (UDP-forming)
MENCSRPGRLLMLLMSAVFLLFTVAALTFAQENLLTPSASRLESGIDAKRPTPVTFELRDNLPFLVGMYDPEASLDDLKANYWSVQSRLGAKIRIFSLYQAWGPNSLTNFPDALVKQVWRHGAIPMITWEPWSSPFPEFKSDRDLHHDRRVFHAIIQGRFDWYVAAYARHLRDYHRPIFLRFGHEPDNPGYPWSYKGGNTPQEYIAGWRHVVELFRREGASNVKFVWNPWHPEEVQRYFPGAPYVDWIGLTLLNYGLAYHNGSWCSFEDLYEPFRRRFVKMGIKTPTMLAEFGTTTYGGSRAKWLGAAMDQIATSHPEIRSVVFFNSGCDPRWPTRWRPPGNPGCIDWSFLNDSAAVATLHSILSRPYFQDAPVVEMTTPDSRR